MQKGGVSNFKQIILLLWIRIGYEYRYLWMHRKKYTNCQVLSLIYPPIIIYCNLTYLQHLFRINDIFEIYALNALLFFQPNVVTHSHSNIVSMFCLSPLSRLSDPLRRSVDQSDSSGRRRTWQQIACSGPGRKYVSALFRGP